MADYLVTEDEVRGIIDTDIADLEPFIKTAHIDIKDTAYPESRKAIIELWAAAHFTAIREKTLTSKTVEGDKENYGWKKGEGYKATRYGQQALDLDYKNELGPGSKEVLVKHTG